MRWEVLGRDDERRQIARLLSRARNGRGGALLLTGEPGIGKTTLLETAGEHLAGVQVLRADGYEAESTVPFAAVQRLVGPLGAHLDGLPDRYRHTLAVASGRAAGAPPDRFLVGLGVLSLLGAAGERQPVVCLVDDAHLLDPESLDAIAFVARRLEAESATLLLAGRESEAFAARTAGVPTLRLAGLPADAAARLLARSLPEAIDPAVGVRVVAATGGNPLALVDLARELTVRQLAQSSLGDEPLPIGTRLEQHYLHQVRLLERDVQLWLLTAAADSTGDVTLIEAAARQQGLVPDAAERAESAGLVALGRSVRFRHPLVRSAAYNAAYGRERREVHRVLSVVAGGLGLTERAVWHAAKATLGTDEQVARRLEQVAEAAAERGGSTSQARMLMEAASLTPPGGRRDARLVRAAEAALVAGTAQVAKDLLDEIDEAQLDPVARGRLAKVDADHAMFVGAPTLTRSGAGMLAAADHFHGHDDDLEQISLVRAWERALASERLTAGLEWSAMGRRLAAGATVKDGPAAVILRAISALILRPYDESVPLVRAALAAYDAMGPTDLLLFGHPSASLASAVWDIDARDRILTRWVDAARDAGALQMLDTALWVCALSEAMGGAPRSAVQYMEQVRELRRAIGYDAEHVVNAAVLAWSDAPRDHVVGIARGAHAMGFGGVHSTAVAALATVELAQGRYDDAYDRLRPLVADPFFHVTPLMWPDFVEACVRSGRLQEARGIAGELDLRATSSGAPWGLGVAARSRALVEAADAQDDPEPHFLAAIGHLQACRAPVDLGRAHLVYGEWLRRARRRRDAASHLRTAAEVCARAGATPFAERAERELWPTGDASRRPAEPAHPGLTPQELTVARLAAAGRTNAEIGATLFLSSHTVDYHLRKVFQRLGVSSRRQLGDRLGAS